MRGGGRQQGGGAQGIRSVFRIKLNKTRRRLGNTETTGEVMKITREWLVANRTLNGGWSRAQLRIIGVAWPPRKGWIEKVAGRELPKRLVLAFIAEMWTENRKINADRKSLRVTDLRPRLVKRQRNSSVEGGV